eukprot:jgi/Galph1/753/GphlegSOOS_G5591.1
MASNYQGRFVRHFNTECGSFRTDIVFERFEDRILLVITQLQKLGTIVSGLFHVCVSSAKDVSVPIFDVVPLLGKHDDEKLTVFARTVGEVVYALGHRKPLVLCLALKSMEKEALDTIVAVLQSDVVPKLVRTNN